MKKKGFTLIELLAVIVILAIIALIATPLVLKYIERSRKEAKVDSTYSYVRNLETAMANYSLKNNGKNYSSGLKNISELTDLDTKLKGENPEGGKVCISSVGQIEKGIFKYKGDYFVSYDGKKAIISDSTLFDTFECSLTISWDGNVENKNAIILDDGVGYYLVSSNIPTSEELISANVILSNGKTVNDILTKVEGGYMSSVDDTPTEQVAYIIVLKDNTYFEGLTIAKAGVYFILVDSTEDEIFYTTSVTFNK